MRTKYSIESKEVAKICDTCTLKKCELDKKQICEIFNKKFKELKKYGKFKV
jgi:hypothetical protein